MKNKFCFSFFFICLNLMNAADAQEKITFPSLDDLIITANQYLIDSVSPLILCCHQARFSRGEYLFTGKKMNELGFNCIAIDQRCGYEVNKIENETAKLANKMQLPVTYLDAEQDIQAAVEYCYKRFHKKIILMGSSYSASLGLKLAKENKHIAAVIAFSPGEYFEGKLNITESITGLNKPVFIASSKEEAPNVRKMAEGIISSTKMFFVPFAMGVHGSKALWPETPDSNDLWVQIQKFLRIVVKKGLD